MIKTILFDLDNTLIDFMRMKRMACEAAVGAMIRAGLKADKRKILKLLFRLYDRHGYEYKRIFQALLKELTGKVDYGIVAAGIVAYRRAREDLLVPYPDVVPTLRKLRRRGIKLAIVTDAPRIEAWIRLAAMGIQDMFDAVVTYDDSKRKKPHPWPFMLALKRLGMSPGETRDILVVGDSVSKDIEPAGILRMKTVLAKYGRIGKAVEKADFVIERFKDLLALIK